MSVFAGLRERVRGRKKKEQQTASGLDVYLKIDGIEGESEDKAHAKEIRVLDYLIDAIGGGRSIGKSGGKVEFNDAFFVVEVDKALIGCLQAGSSGKHIASAVLTVRKAGGGPQDFLKWTFSDFIISMVRMVDPGYTSGLAFLSFNFSKLEVEYKEQKADGSLGAAVNAGFDLRTKK
jgi:type VI secretion system secreted protein Hcp